MRNPRWTRDEEIVVLDLYFRMKEKGEELLFDIEEVRKVLKSLPSRPAVIDEETFRNVNGLRLHLAGFKGLDPDYPGRGMSNVSMLTMAVWDEFWKRRAQLRLEAVRLWGSAGMTHPESFVGVFPELSEEPRVGLSRLFDGLLSEEDLQRPVAHLRLNNRMYKVFQDNGIFTISDLAKMSESDLVKLKDFGYGCLDVLTEQLACIKFQGEEYFSGVEHECFDQKLVRLLNWDYGLEFSTLAKWLGYPISNMRKDLRGEKSVNWTGFPLADGDIEAVRGMLKDGLSSCESSGRFYYLLKSQKDNEDFCVLVIESKAVRAYFAADFSECLVVSECEASELSGVALETPAAVAVADSDMKPVAFNEDVLFDAETIGILRDRYGVKVRQIADWIGKSVPWVYQALESGRKDSSWRVYEFSDFDKQVVSRMVDNRAFSSEEPTCDYRLINDKDSDFCLVSICPGEIRIFFKEDFPQVLRNVVEKAEMHCLTQDEVLQKDSYGEFVFILGVRHFKAFDSTHFRSMAALRQMSMDAYSLFLYGVPYCRSNFGATDKEVKAFLEDISKDGIVCILPSEEPTWLRSFRRKNSLSFEALLEFYGFSLSDGEKEGSPVKEEILLDAPGSSSIPGGPNEGASEIGEGDMLPNSVSEESVQQAMPSVSNCENKSGLVLTSEDSTAEIRADSISSQHLSLHSYPPACGIFDDRRFLQGEELAERIKSLRVGDVLCHKTSGYGKVRLVDREAGRVLVRIGRKDRDFALPDAFYQGLLRLRKDSGGQLRKSENGHDETADE